MPKFRLGLSSNTIEPALVGTHIDGMGVYTRKLLQHFTTQDDVDVQLFAYPRGLKTSLHTDYRNGHFWPYPFSTATLFSFLTHRPLLKTNIDIFHATDYRIPKLTCPVIATLHDAISLQHPEWARASFRSIKNFLIRQSAKYADHIISLSKAVIPDLVQHFNIPADRISVVHCGVDEEWLAPLSDITLQQIKQKYQLPSHYYLFVGTLQPRKNILRILQAFKALPKEIRREKKLVLVGQIGWGVTEALTLLHELIQQQEVIWLQNIHEEIELRALYQNAGVFVFPSLYEGFGIPVLEAFASKVPVLTSNTSALPEVAGNAAMIIDPTDIDAITHGMQQLMTDETLRQHAITEGYARAQQKTWAACAKATLAIYRKCL